MEIVFLNGQFIEQENVVIHMEDRGYQFGDGIYEVIGVYNNHSFKMLEHMERLKASAEKIKINLPYTTEQLAKNLEQLRKMNKLTNGLIYLQVTRGIANRNHPIPSVKITP